MAPFVSPARDDGARPGRAKNASGTVYYCIPGVATTDAMGSQFITVIDFDYYSSFYVATPIVVDQLAFEVAVAEASKNARCGFYRADLDWQPIGAPLADSGDISLGTTGTKTYTPGTPIYLARGRYVSVFASQGTTAAIRVVKGAPLGAAIDTPLINSFVRRMANSRSYAAFPTPGGTWETLTGSNVTPFENLVVYRVSAP